MRIFQRGVLVALNVLVLLGSAMPVQAAEPEPAVKSGPSIVLAGGCFWGMEMVFEHVKGVTHTTVGYAGGTANTATYKDVSAGQTGHAESIQITYDPSVISLKQLLEIYFTVAHDPHQLNGQGNDIGPQYRSSVFYATPEQENAAKEEIAQLNAANAAADPIVTTVIPLNGFYPAETYHQHYGDQHPNEPYIARVETPRVDNLKKQYPALYVEK